MSKESNKRAQKQAAFLKERKIERTTGMCPWGCGRAVNNGGQALMTHLNFCKGRKAK